MLPLFRSGDIVFALNARFFRLKKEDVIILKDPRDKRLLVKRIQKIEQKMLFVVGDNISKSTDSRTFGWVEKKHILGKVVLKI
jgi:type IV secretory pathway protease TraF